VCFRALEAEAIELQGKDGWFGVGFFEWWIEKLGVEGKSTRVRFLLVFSVVWDGLYMVSGGVYNDFGWFVCHLCLS